MDPNNEKQNAKFDRSISKCEIGLASIEHHSTSNVVAIRVKPNDENKAHGSTEQEIWLDIDELEDLMGLMDIIKQEDAK